MNWDQNPESSKLPTLAVGDLASLMATDVFRYLFNVKVTLINNDLISGVVQAIFDGTSGAEVLGGDIVQYVGKSVSFNESNIFNVIKKR